MNKGVEHEIRERAYGLWVLSGMVDGHADAHWLSAEAAIHAEAAGSRKPAARTAPVAKTSKTVSKATSKIAGKDKPAPAVAKASAAVVRKPKASAAASLGVGA